MLVNRQSASAAMSGLDAKEQTDGKAEEETWGSAMAVWRQLTRFSGYECGWVRVEAAPADRPGH